MNSRKSITSSLDPTLVSLLKALTRKQQLEIVDLLAPAQYRKASFQREVLLVHHAISDHLALHGKSSNPRIPSYPSQLHELTLRLMGAATLAYGPEPKVATFDHFIRALAYLAVENLVARDESLSYTRMIALLTNQFPALLEQEVEGGARSMLGYVIALAHAHAARAIQD